jgi:uncharacterized membrane protein
MIAVAVVTVVGLVGSIIYACTCAYRPSDVCGWFSEFLVVYWISDIVLSAFVVSCIWCEERKQRMRMQQELAASMETESVSTVSVI